MGAAAAQTYRPVFHPDQLKGPPAGPLNQVLVVGSPHLAQMGGAVTAEMLTPLLDRLAAWGPEVIAIENVSGLHCDAMRRHPQRYAPIIGATVKLGALPQLASAAFFSSSSSHSSSTASRSARALSAAFMARSKAAGSRV